MRYIRVFQILNNFNAILLLLVIANYSNLYINFNEEKKIGAYLIRYRTALEEIQKAC